MATARSTMHAGVDRTMMPMHDRVDDDRPLTFAFVLGGGRQS